LDIRKVSQLTDCQDIIRAKIEAAVKVANCSDIEYKSEWLGQLPFGVYHWIECLGEDFSRDFPSGWSESDLTALEHAGFLERIDEYRNPKDEFDMRRKYRVHLQPAEGAA
jgi:hypothetical protein